MTYTQFVIKCGICENILATIEADPDMRLTEEDALLYQQNFSCNVDGSADIQITKT